MITLSVNGLNAPIKRHRIAEWIRKHDPHICCLQDTHLRTKDIHRLKVKGWKQIFQANGQGKKSWGSNTYMTENRLQKKGYKTRPRRPLDYTEGKYASRRCKHCKYICTQQRSTPIHKENLGGLQERYRHQHIYTRGFQHPLSKWIDLPTKISRRVLQNWMMP